MSAFVSSSQNLSTVYKIDCDIDGNGHWQLRGCIPLTAKTLIVHKAANWVQMHGVEKKAQTGDFDVMCAIHDSK